MRNTIYFLDKRGLGSTEMLGKPLKDRVLEAFSVYEDIEIKKIKYLTEIKDTNQVLVLCSNTYIDDELKERVYNYFKSGATKEYKIGEGFFGTVENYKSNAIQEDFQEDIIVIKNSYQFTDLYKKLREKNIKKHMDNGVIILSPESVIIEDDVEIAPGVILHENLKLCGKTVIEKQVEVYDGSVICNSHIAAKATIQMARIYDSFVGEKTTVGPFAYIRNETQIGKGCRIGDYNEIKNSIIGDDVKMAHHAYVGDAEVGDRTNIGCGTVFVNFNGRIKQRTIVGEDCFIGSNVNLVAPIIIGKGAYIAAGSTVTKNLKPGSFCIARQREYIKNIWRGVK